MEGNPTMSILLFLLFLLLFALPVALGLSKLFKKAGEAGWKGFVPIYNLVIMLRLIGRPASWAWAICGNYLFTFVWSLLRGDVNSDLYRVIYISLSVLSFVFLVRAFFTLSYSYGKDGVFTVWLVILPFVFFPVLGYGKSRYEGPFGDPDAYDAFQAGLNGSFDFEHDILAN